jgi:hypothetical protein
MRRALRQGPVAALLCVIVAVIAGLEVAPLPNRADDLQPAGRAGLERSTDVVGRWLQPVLPASAAALDAAPPIQYVVAERALPMTVVVDVPGSTGSPEGGLLDVPSARVLPVAPRLSPGDRPMVTLSFYYCEDSGGVHERGDGGAFCGRMRDGTFVRPGAAACDVAYLGQRFRITGDPTGRTYYCGDTGSAVHGMHRDIWFLDNRSGWEWQSRVGRAAVIEILP